MDTLGAKSMANGIKEAIQRKDELGEEVKLLKQQRNARWEGQANDLKLRIDSLVKAAV